MKLTKAMQKAIEVFSKEKPDAMIRTVSFVDGTGDQMIYKATFHIEYCKKNEGYSESDTHPLYVTVRDDGVSLKSGRRTIKTEISII